MVWLGIVLASLAVASVFLTYSAADFTTRSVVTTIETTTASLHVRVFIFNTKNQDLRSWF